MSSSDAPPGDKSSNKASLFFYILHLTLFSYMSGFICLRNTKDSHNRLIIFQFSKESSSTEIKSSKKWQKVSAMPSHFYKICSLKYHTLLLGMKIDTLAYRHVCFWINHYPLRDYNVHKQLDYTEAWRWKVLKLIKKCYPQNSGVL